ncbi:hypothetical protein [uncultured Desulfobulbus sp.]|uniref:hypothetical protein n=1 Tax=uncultured Desulfobulbus sp. TaxID=239745 RepID=UPI0029C68EFF|nr:hypothetical protein [uncultured Desulfobulbus sp.]
MPSFRSSKAQAEHAVSRKIALGTGRHDHQNDGRIHSLGTARGYEQALKGFADYLRQHRLGDLRSASEEEARHYLAERSQLVGQKTLDLDRQAIQIHLGQKLEIVCSSKESTLSTRSYTPAQMERIAHAQSGANSLATRLAYYAGLRANELLTLRPAGEQSTSGYRQWSTERFTGRDGDRYTVVGKGGLVREVVLSGELVTALEARRLAEPRLVIDRGVHYSQHYDIGGGRTWGQSFSSASKRELGFSNGGHGLRHSYAQERKIESQQRELFNARAKMKRLAGKQRRKPVDQAPWPEYSDDM